MTFAALAARILAEPCPHPVRLVSVDGGAGAGKTTFAALLAEAIACPVVQLDDFISFGDLERWWPRFEEQVLHPLWRRESPHFQVRDWEHDVGGSSLGPWKSMAWNETLVVEGVGAGRLALEDRLSFRVWIETPRDVCLRRGLERDAVVPSADRYWEEWMHLEAAFFARDRAWERADVRVDGLARSAEARSSR